MNCTYLPFEITNAYKITGMCLEHVANIVEINKIVLNKKMFDLCFVNVSKRLKKGSPEVVKLTVSVFEMLFQTNEQVFYYRKIDWYSQNIVQVSPVPNVFLILKLYFMQEWYFIHQMCCNTMSITFE